MPAELRAERELHQSAFIEDARERWVNTEHALTINGDTPVGKLDGQRVGVARVAQAGRATKLQLTNVRDARQAGVR